MLRRVNREMAVALAGPRSLLMQAAHPVAFAGFFEATTMLAEPYPRLERTARVLQAIGFGTRAEADAATAPVRAIHRRVSGTLKEPAGRFPAGTPWRADDPELLLWIIATLVDSNLLVYQRYVGRCRATSRRPTGRTSGCSAKLFGLPYKHSPPDLDAFEAYIAGVLASGDLHVGDKARGLAVDIVMRPPVPLQLRPLLEVANQITVGLLPPSIRRLYGFRWDPVRGLAVRGGAEYLRRVVVPLLPERWRIAPSAPARSVSCRRRTLAGITEARLVAASVRMGCCGTLDQRRWRLARRCAAPRRARERRGRRGARRPSARTRGRRAAGRRSPTRGRGSGRRGASGRSAGGSERDASWRARCGGRCGRARRGRRRRAR